MNDKDRRSGLDIAKVLGILGGIVTIIDGVLSLLSPFDSRRSLPSLDFIIGVATFSFLLIVLGVVALLASAHLSSLGWCVVVIGVGLLAYRFGADYLYDLGPVLLVVSGIVGIAVRFA